MIATPARFVAAAVLLLVLADRAPAAPRDTLATLAPRAKAALLHRWAEERLGDRSVESRQRALRDLEDAIALDPLDGEHWLLLGRFQVLGEYDVAARASFARALELEPQDPRAWLEYGRTWKRQWLRTLDSTAAARAEAAFDTAAIVRPFGAEAWLELVPMRYERGDLAGALDAAERARRARPRRPEALVADAYLRYRIGDLERADTLFRAAIPLLPERFRALMLDAPAWFRGLPEKLGRTPSHASLSAPEAAAGDGDGAPQDVGERASRGATMDSSASFWRRSDPDPTTAVNEMQLEYWSRVAHAWFVFFDPARPSLDARAETYVRYGPPSHVENNPGGVPLSYAPLRLFDPHSHSELSYPMLVQGWHYPELGMRVVLDDQSLHGRFTPRVDREYDALSAPNPAVLAARRDLVAFGGGAAVFPTLPPREQRVELRGALLRFEGAKGPRLLVQVRAAASPADAITGRWVALDRDGRTLASDDLALGISACDPTEWRLAEVGADLPAGTASVTVSVRDAHRRRGLFRANAELAPAPAGLAMSDLVLCCGDPTLFARSGIVRFEANMDGHVRGRLPVSVYFELYRLALDAEGRSRFEYEYRVRRVLPSGKKARREEKPVVLSTWREESNAGAMRRQFVNVPIEALSAGRYRLEVRVRDLANGAETERGVEFERR